MLLQAWWWEFFHEKYVTSQEIIDLANDEATMDVPERVQGREGHYRSISWMVLRSVLDNLEIRNGCDLDSILDEVKNKVVFNFLVERDGSCLQPMKWRVIKQEHEYRRMTDEEREAFLAERKEAGLKIDPATAEVDWSYEQTLDPYGIDPDLPEELQQVGRQYFARTPGSDIWVSFYDLPDETRQMLWNMLRA
jgi:hypothetical protein